jgi:glutathione S-transferase
VEDALLDLQHGDQFDPAYLRLNPNGVVPTLEHAGSVMTKSPLMDEYLHEDTGSEWISPLRRSL